jgi:hypothetical protein
MCQGLCETNREGIQFVIIDHVRYGLGMRACKKCEKAWITNQKFCHCCRTQLRIKRRQKA